MKDLLIEFVCTYATYIRYVIGEYTDDSGVLCSVHGTHYACTHYTITVDNN